MSSTTAEQDAAGAADDDSVEAELFGEDDGGDDPSEDKAAVAAAAAPVAAPAAPADSKALSFSIPKIKKESAEGTAPATTTPTASNASAATTPTLASPPKHGHDDTSPRRKLSNGGGGGDSLQLPDELVLSVSAREVLATDRTNRLRTLLLKLPLKSMADALEEYDEAIQQKKPIRNHIGFLTGILKRYLSVQERTSRPGDGGGAMGEMTAAVKGLIQTKLLDSGFCTELDLDEKIMTKVKQLPERDALAAIEEISRCDRSSIRNFSSYFMGILHRYMRGERDGAAGGGAGGPPHGGRRPPHHHDDRHRGGPPPPPHHRGLDQYGGGRNDQDRHFGRSYERRGGRHERDRSPEYDRRRDDHHRDRGRERRPYDDRRDRDRSPDGYYGGGRSRRRYSSRSRSRSRSPSDNRSPYGRERKYSRDEGSNSSRRESRWGTNSSSGAPPGASPIPQPGLSQYGPFGGSSSSSWGAAPPQPPPQQPVGTRVFAPPPASVAQPTATSYYGQPPVGVYGSAATVAPTAPYGQIPGVPPPAPAAATGIPGLDLASLASQAQQALSTIRALDLPGAPVASAPAGRPMQVQQQPYQQQQQQQQQQQAAEVVTESDLPLMVQYSLTNLKTTGHIDPAGLDPGVCRMLKLVPENVALSALEKFQSCDTSLMRNKNSYLAGIIKRKREEGGF